MRELWGNDEATILDVAAASRGIRRSATERDQPRRSIHPFDADRKRMSLFRADGAL